MLARLFALCVLAPIALAGCSGSGAAKPDAADRAFLQRMIPHHERAIGVAQIGERSASDPRVRAFAARIVREQTPELEKMQKAAKGLGLDFRAGAMTADHRIADTQVTALRGLTGLAFDRQFLRLHIGSEGGAAAMARTEVAGGDVGPLLKLARSIASAPTTQIPELQRLLTALS